MKLSLKQPFIQAIYIAPFQVHYYTEALPTQHVGVSEFHAKAPQATASEELAQGPYIQTKGDKFTNEPPRL